MKFKLNSLLKKPTDKELLNLWQKAVKLRAGYKCEYPGCSKTEYLNAHHIHSKSKAGTKFDTDNGICLCSGHHSLNNNSAHKDPDFKDIIIEADVRSRKFFERLRLRAFTPTKIDKNLIKIDLEQQIKLYERNV